VRVSTKGQVTIPLALRERLGIVPGTEVEFIVDKNTLCLRKVDGTGRGKRLVAQMSGRGSVRMTTDEILGLTRGDR
jgi:antitoxin PrlF